MTTTGIFCPENGWGPAARVNFVMLNPSTADDVLDDATIRRCIGFAKRWGFSKLVVTNLFAWRATFPKELKDWYKREPDLAVGYKNILHLTEAAKISDKIVCAWGHHPFASQHALRVMKEPLLGRPLWCIRKTASGAPAHPVREKYTSEPVFFEHFI